MKFFLLSFIVVLITVFLATPSPARAQDDNSFSCQYYPATGCVVDIDNCDPGYHSDDEVCTSITDMGECQTTFDQSCVLNELPEDTRWVWNSISDSCQPTTDENAPYETEEECEADHAPPSDEEEGDTIAVRAQECTTNIVAVPGDYESDPVMAPGIKTALGCIPYDPGPLVTWIFNLAIFVGGGIAFLIMGVGAFLFITSQGNPEQIQKGKEIMVSAGAGLLFMIFAIFLLRLIGVDILRIPGFE